MARRPPRNVALSRTLIDRVGVEDMPRTVVIRLGTGDQNPVTASIARYTAPVTAPSSGGWGVSVDGNPTWVHSMYWGSADTQRMATYSTDAAAPVSVTVSTPLSVTSAKVLPAALGITPSITSNSATFTLPTGFHGHVVVEFNGLLTNQLQLSALPLEPTINPADYTYYFGPGTDTLITSAYGGSSTGEIVLTDGQSCYIHGSALVRGKIRTGPTGRTGTAASNVTIAGRGVLDSTLFSGSPGRALRFHKTTTARATGITVVNVEHWAAVSYESSDVVCDWMRVFSTRTTADVGTPDGFDVVGSSSVTLRNSFVRAYDDAISVKCDKNGWFGNTSTVVAENCVVVQGDGGNAHEIGYENGIYTISGVTFRGNTIIRKTARSTVTPSDTYRRAALGLHTTGSGPVNDILFEDIVIESTAENQCWIGNCGTGSLQDGTGPTTGTSAISGVTFRRVRWPSNALPWILSAGSGSLNAVTFDTCYEGSTMLATPTGMTVTNVTNLVFLPVALMPGAALTPSATLVPAGP